MSEEEKPTLRSRFLQALATARTWTITILVVMVAFKLAWVVWTGLDGALRCRAWEWALLPLVATYQHLAMAAVIFFVYTLLLSLGLLGRAGRIAGLILVSIIQGAGVFYYAAALRIALLVGSPPTFGFLKAGAQGGVFGSSLIQVEQIVYTVLGVMLAVSTLVIPLRIHRRHPGWPRRDKLLGILALLLAWALAGALADRKVRTDLHHANTDPVLMLAREVLEQHIERERPVVAHPEGAFPVELIYGDGSVHRIRHELHDLDEFRNTRRNVVLIVLESLQVDNASFMGPVTNAGERRDTFPTLSALRDNMLVAENHYTVHTMSMEALFSIACSLYPYPLSSTITEINPRIPCGSISETLADQGYEAGLFHSGHFSFWHKDRFFRDRGFSVRYDADSMPGHEDAFEYNWGIDERVTAEAIAEYIRDHRDESFFVQYIPVFPHAPYRVPDDVETVFRGDRPLDRYHNSLHYVDSALEIIVSALRETELLDDTLLIVVGDHGEAFDEHPGNRIHSIFAYEENIHVPLAFHNPLLFRNAPEVTRVTSHVDILPTVADLLGIEPNPAWQGSSMVRDGPSGLVYFYSITGRYLVGLRDGRYKVIWNRDRDTLEIFDLATDPDEEHNLVETFASPVEPYRRALSQWRDYQLVLIPNFGLEEPEQREGVTQLATIQPDQTYQPHGYDPIPNRTIAGNELDIDRTVYHRGLGTHADSRYTYDISELGALRLTGRVGRDREPVPGRVHAYIFIDGRLAFASASLTRGTPACGFDLDVSDARQFSIVAWRGTDSGRGDHLDWADIELITNPEHVYRPGEPLSVDEIVPSGRNDAAMDARPISALPHGRFWFGDERITRGMMLPAGSVVRYDVRPLGTARVQGRLLGRGYGDGERPEWFEIRMDGRQVLRAELAEVGEDGVVEIDIPVRPGTRLVDLRVASSDGGEEAGVVIADLRLITSEEAIEAARESMDRTSGHDWPLGLVPFAPPIPARLDAGVGVTNDIAPSSVDVPDRREAVWVRGGSRINYDLTGLHLRSLEGTVLVVGSEDCRARALVRSRGSVLWTSDPLGPGDEPQELTVEIRRHAELSLEAVGPSECIVVWAETTLER